MTTPTPATATETALAPEDAERITERVRERYAGAAQRVQQMEQGCCTPQALEGGCCAPSGSEVSQGIYCAEEVADLPRRGGARLAWLWQPNGAH